MVKIHRDIKEISDTIAEALLKIGYSNAGEPFHIALSGGNTPKMIFKYLAENYGMKLANKRFNFWWVDERCVPIANDDSNFKWAYELWLRPIGVNTENIHRIIGENSPVVEAIRYSIEIRQLIDISNGYPRFDLILLGLGDDGHTASIFPDQMNLLTSEEWCEVASHPTSGQKRITLTGTVINNADKVIFITTGAEKAQMVKNIIRDSNSIYPASQINPTNGEVIWLLDMEAARLL